MITIEQVLTATPVILEKVPGSFSLAERANPILEGLNLTTAKFLEEYTLSNVATSLPENTGGEESEHTELLTMTATHIAEAVRASLGVIKERVIPSCDVIEENIKKIGNLSNIYDLIFNKLFIKFHYISQDLFNSHLFPAEIPELYRNGVAFTTSNLTELGTWPQKEYEEILAYIKPAMAYPEFYPALSDHDSVMAAWNSLGRPVDWLKTLHDTINPAELKVGFADLNKLVVLTLLVNRFVANDDPIAGVTGISLEDYRRQLLHVKRFLEATLYHFKRRYQIGLANGLSVNQSQVKFEKCDDDRSPFFGAFVANGGVEVVYTETLSDFIANSDEYSLSTIVLGIVIATQKKMKAPCDTLLDNLKFYTETATLYAQGLRTQVGENGKIATAKAIRDSIHQLAHSEIWRDILVKDGENLGWSLDKRLNAAGGITNLLMPVSVYQRIQSGELRVANTDVAVVLAAALGYPIAVDILKRNIHKGPGVSEEKQRKILAKSIARYIILTLLKKREG